MTIIDELSCGWQDGTTALHVACEKGDMNTVVLLTEAGAMLDGVATQVPCPFQ